MKEFKINMIKLSDASIKTLLVYPPLYNIEPFPHLGLANLQSFLKRENYKNVKIVDFNRLYNKKFPLMPLRKNLVKIYSKYPKKLIKKSSLMRRLKEMAVPELVKNNIFGWSPVGEFSVWSLKGILDKGLNDLVEFNRFKSLMKGLDGFGLVGFSVVYPEQLFSALICARLFKDLFPDVFVVFGGPMISKNLDFLLNQGLGGFVDGLIIGDGEIPLAELVNVLEEKGDLCSVSNLYFLKNGVFIKSEGSTYYFDPIRDFVVPDFKGLSFEKKLPLRVSVGCPWGKCTFCTFKNSSLERRDSRIERVVAVMKNLTDSYGVNYFPLIGDSLEVSFLEKLSQELLSEGLKVRWSCYLAPDPKFLNEQIISLLARAGCDKVHIGIESASPRILKLMNKPFRGVDTMECILRLFKVNGIKTVGFVMFGFPSETKEEAQETIDFLLDKRNLFHRIKIQSFTLEENILILDNPSFFGVSKIEKSDKSYGKRLGFAYSTSTGMTPKEVNSFVKLAEDLFC